MGIPFNYTDFRGGFNSFNAYDDLADNEARDVVNLQGNVAGAIVKRGGFLPFWNATDALNSLFVPVDYNVLAGVDDTTGNILAFDRLTTTTHTVKTGLTAGKPWQFVRAPVVAGQGPTYGLNAVDTPQQWNENVASTSAAWTATDAGGSVPNGAYALYHNNQVFVTGVASNPSRVYWSGLADPTAWNPANLNGSGFEDFDPNDGQVITGISTVGPYLLVFKPRKTWVLVDPATATTRRLSDSVGCVAHRTIAPSPEGTYFLASDGQVYLTSGSKMQRISDKIRPTVQALMAPYAACYFDSHYLLAAVPASGNVVLDFDVRLQSWWKHAVTAGVRDWAVATDTSVGASILLASHRTDSHVSQAFAAGVYQDLGSNFTWSWSGPWQSPTFYRRRRFPTPFFRKRHRQTRYDGLGQVDFSICKDFNTTPALVASDIFGNSTITKEARSYGQGVANAFSIVFSGTYNAPAQVNQYTLLISDRKDSMGSGY